ncbi:ATP-binding protein [Thalassotalea euphylliae]|nr:ATP-binding protein [Thalassotalea euphylliae]
MRHWRPSLDTRNQSKVNEFWVLFDTIINEAISLEPLKSAQQKNGEVFPYYIQRRSYFSAETLEKLKSKISIKFKHYQLGEQEIDLIGMLTNYSGRRQIAIVGHRGVGKSSFINYVSWVIQQSGVNEGSQFLNIDCRAIIESEGKISLCQLFYDAVEALPSEVFGRELLKKVKAILKEDKTESITGALTHLSRKLQKPQKDKLVVVFDNLDHLHCDFIAKATALSRQISIQTDLPTIVCIRPNSMQRLALRGNSRAMFGYRLNLSPPDFTVWFNMLGERVVNTFMKHRSSNKTTYKLYNRTVTKTNLLNFFSSVNHLLRGRQPDDDVFKLMETISSDDTRHLALIIMRLFCHHGFPVYPLFLQKTIEGHLHHPLHYLMRAEHDIYRSDTALITIPNLLYVECGNEESYLLPYRTLSLIADGVIIYKNIVACLSLMGYSERLVQQTLNKLMLTLLIRGTTSVSIDRVGEPEAFYLTQSGHYYVESFISTPDYLTNVILDVKAEHKSFYTYCNSRKSDTEFTPRLVDLLDSIEEYLKKAFELEKSALTKLTSKPKSEPLYQLTKSIHNFGFLTDRIWEGLTSLLKRIDGSRFKRLAEIELMAQEVIEEVHSFREHRFQELLNKCTNEHNFEHCELDFNIQETNVQLLLDNGMGGTNIKVAVDANGSYTRDSTYLIALAANDGEGEVYYATKATGYFNSAHQKSQYIRNYQTFPSLNLPFEQACEKQRYNVKLTQVTPSREDIVRSNLAIINTYLNQNTLKIVLSIVGGDDCSEHIIGSHADFPALQSLVDEQVSSISALASQGKLTHAALDVAGSTLASNILTPEGESLLATHLHMVNKAVLCINRELLGIPWEWIRPRPKPGAQTLAIGQAWHLYRNVLDDSNFVKIDFTAFDYQLSTDKYLAFGIQPAEEIEQTVNTPSSLPELYQHLEHSSIIHLVGHHDESNANIVLGESSIGSIDDHTLTINYAEADAYSFEGKDSLLVLSSCGVSLSPYHNNIAIKLCERNGCEVWSPLIIIPYQYAQQLHHHFAQLHQQEQEMSIAAVWEHVMKCDTTIAERIYTRYLNME